MEPVIDCNFRYSNFNTHCLGGIETGKMLYYDYILYDGRLHEHPVFPQPSSLAA